MRGLSVANVTGFRALPHHPRVTQAPPRLQPVPSSLHKLLRGEYTQEHALWLACEQCYTRKATLLCSSSVLLLSTLKPVGGIREED